MMRIRRCVPQVLDHMIMMVVIDTRVNSQASFQPYFQCLETHHHIIYEFLNIDQVNRFYTSWGSQRRYEKLKIPLKSFALIEKKEELGMRATESVTSPRGVWYSCASSPLQDSSSTLQHSFLLDVFQVHFFLFFFSCSCSSCQ